MVGINYCIGKSVTNGILIFAFEYIFFKLEESVILILMRKHDNVFLLK